MKLLDEVNLLQSKCVGEQGVGTVPLQFPGLWLMRPLNSCPHQAHESVSSTMCIQIIEIIQMKWIQKIYYFMNSDSFLSVHQQGSKLDHLHSCFIQKDAIILPIPFYHPSYSHVLSQKVLIWSQYLHKLLIKIIIILNGNDAGISTNDNIQEEN